MAGYADRTTFAEFARRAREGQYTPNPGENRVTQAGSGPVRLQAATGKIVGQIVVSDIKTRITQGVDVRGRPFRPLKHARPRGGNKPLLDTGRLLASFTYRVQPDVIVGTNHPGAAIHNFGGLVRAKGKMLAIPLTKEAQRSGGPRRFGKRKELEFRPIGRRKFLLGVEDVKGRFVGHFLLVDQVRIPQREFMGLSEKGLGQVADVLATAGLRTASGV